MSQDRWLAGGISGGCLEGEVLKKAWWRTREGPVVLSYDSSTTDDELSWSYGLGCNGRVEVLQERVPADGAPTNPLDFLHGLLERRKSGVMATVFRVGRTAAARVGERLLLDENEARSDVKDGALRERLLADAEVALGRGRTAVHRYGSGEAAVDVLLEVVQPPRPLFAFGVPADAFREADVVLNATPETARGKVALTEEAAAIVMTHNLAHDRGFLRFVLDSPCAYVGALGPRARTEQMLSEMQTEGFVLTEAHRRRLHSPTGLDVGAEQSEEIALAVLSEVLASAAAREGASLRLRAGPIHPRGQEQAG